MRVLIAVFTYYPDVNGVQYVTQYQAEGLASLGHEVRVITSCHSSKAPAKELHNGVDILRIDMWDANMLHFGDKKAYRLLLLEEAAVSDVVMLVCPESWPTDCALSVVDRIPCAKVLMVHGIHDFRGTRSKDCSAYAIMKKMVGDMRWWPFYRMHWRTFRKFDDVIQLDHNDFGYRYFRQHDISSQVLCNAVDTRFLERVEKKQRIINVGTFHRSKNQIGCLDVFYRSNVPGWELTLIGPAKNTYYHAVVEHQARLEAKYGHREVQIIVGENREDTIRHIKESAVYLLTSVTEMQPVSLLEAMASGAAFVSTDVGVVRFLPGGLVRDSVEEMTEAIEYLTANDRWKTYGAMAREFADDNCRMGNQVKRLESIMEKAIAKHG